MNGHLRPDTESTPSPKRRNAELLQADLLCDPRPLVDVTQPGVTLRYLLELLDLGLVADSWTIQDVVDKVVRPKTAATKCCLFDLVPSLHTASPQYFVSHTWSRKYSDLMKLLKTHFNVTVSTDAAAGMVLWLDIIAINQHPYTSKGVLLNADVANLAKVVKATEKTLFCLDEECTSLTRIWCLFEVWQTFMNKGAPGLLVLMPDVESGTLTDLFKTFDVKNAEATQAADRVRILDEIGRANGGATQVNLQLKRALVDSARYEAEHTAASGAEKSRILTKAGDIFMANGQYMDAEPMYRMALEIRKRVLGAYHPDTISSMGNLAACLRFNGKPGEAEPMYRQALADRTRVLGADHPDTIASVNGLAACLYTHVKYAEAEPVFRQALADRTRVLGADHPDTISSVNNLAACLNDQGVPAEAEPMYRQALAARTRVLGADHPDTIGSVNSLANCLAAQGKTTEAEPMFRQALADRTRVLGADHPDTIDSVNNLGNWLAAKGKYAEVEPVYRQALAARTRVLHADHPDTIDSVNNLANCLAAQGKYGEAEPMFRQALASRTRMLGADHPDTISNVNNLAKFLDAQGKDYSELEPVYRWSFEGRAGVAGACLDDDVLVVAHLGAGGLGEDEVPYADEVPYEDEVPYYI